MGGRVGFHTKQNYSWLCTFHISKNKSKEIILSNTARKTLKIRMKNLNEIHTRHPLISLQFLHLSSRLYNQRWLLRGQREILFTLLTIDSLLLDIIARICTSHLFASFKRACGWDYSPETEDYPRQPMERMHKTLFSQFLWICHPLDKMILPMIVGICVLCRIGTSESFIFPNTTKHSCSVLSGFPKETTGPQGK